MIDPNIIRANYAKMPDKELLRFAAEEGKDLTEEALALLEQEFTYRNFDKTIFTTIREKGGNQREKEDTDEQFFSAGAANLSGGLTYQEMMYAKEKEPIAESKEKFIASLPHEEAQKLIAKCESSMLKNGIICVIGIVITAITLKMAENGGTYVVAWGAIIFGGIGFFRALSGRDELKAALNNSSEKKEDTPTDPPAQV